MTMRRALGEAWAVFEALRRLGFSSDDIFFQVGGEVSRGMYQICIVLRAQNREFTAIPCAVQGDPEEIEQQWLQFAQAVVNGTVAETELSAIWKNSQALLGAASLCAALLRKGFSFNGALN